MPQLFRRFWYLLNRRRLEAELAEELEFHRTLKQAELEGSGLPPERARHAARRILGPELLAREDARAVWIPPLLDSIWNDIRYALRGLRRNPSFAAGAVATLAIGIGAASAIFSLIDTVILRPLPVPGASRLVRLETRYPTSDSQLAFPESYKAWRDQTSIFDAVSADRLEFMNLTGDAAPELIPVARVTASFFRIFSAMPMYGRVFSADEDRPGGPELAVLDAGFWASQFGSDPRVVGRAIDLNGVPHVVIGILPANYDTRQFSHRPEIWIPLQYELNRNDGGDYSTATARLRPGVTVATANAKLAVAFAAAHPASSKSSASRTTWAAVPLHDAMIGNVRDPLLILFAAVGLMLLAACANVANLLLVRADVRKRELAIRRATGAGRARILRQSIAECAVLSLTGGALGLGMGMAGIRAILAAFPAANPFNAANGAGPLPAIAQAAAPQLNWHVLAFALILSAAVAVAFGLLIVLANTRQEPYRALKYGDGVSAAGAGRSWFRDGMIIGQVAVALMLVIGAMLLVRTSLALRNVDPGFHADHVLTMRMSIKGTRFQTSGGVKDLARKAREELSSVPGVIAAGAGCCMPLETVWQLPFVIQGRPSASLTTAGNLVFSGFGGWTFVSPGYFAALGIPLLRGREFTASDAAGAPGVVIINEAMARKFWPHGDALGAQLRIGRGMGPQFEKDPTREIVGIVGNVRDTALERQPRPAMYVPIAQLPDELLARQARLLPLVWFVRTALAPYSLSAPVSAALQGVSGDLPVARIRSMEEVVLESTARTRFEMLLLTVFGVGSLLLAAVGVYGLIAYTVEQRTREIAIRVALGAPSTAIRNMVIGQGMKPAAAGVVLGVIGALGLDRVLAGFLYGVTAHDPLVFLATSLLVAVAALMATLLPARRARRIDPIVALRAE
ncbi:MAG TPA: ABC transporter permease [Gammaproteobacteria bacterium]|nr:ABC transporter permease [Gammaproteobacteria bacterium]